MPHEPKKRHSRARKGKRRASIHLAMSSAIVCKNCSSMVLPHMVCKACGFYDGKQILTIKTKTA